MTDIDNLNPIQRRAHCKLLIARQLAINNGYRWQEQPSTTQQRKAQATFSTHAESILATVERTAYTFRW